MKLLVALLFLALAAHPLGAIAAPTVEIPVILSLTGNAAFAGHVVYCFSPSIDTAPGSFMFATATSSDSIMSAELNYAAFKAYHRVTAIVTTDAAGQHDESAFRRIFASGIKDVQLVDVEHMQPASPSVTAQLVKIQAANPEVLFIYATGGDFGTDRLDWTAVSAGGGRPL